MKTKFFTSTAFRLSAALLVVVGTLTACKDYLEVNPKATPRSDNFYSTPENALLGINGIYSVLRINSFNDGLFPMLDIMSDDARKGSNPGDAQANIGLPYEQFQHNPVTENTVSWYFTLYQGVRRANAMIDVLPGVTMEDAKKNRYLAEARFLRALFYLDLTRGFNNIPVTLTANPDEPGAIRQDSGRNIYDQIIKPDLQFARENLPVSYGGGDVGRATKGAANGLLARAGLYFKDYASALEAAQQVINSGVYGLETDYRFAFYQEGNYGVESVFEVGAIGQESEAQGGNGYGNVQGVRGAPNKGWGFNRHTVNLLREFEPGDVRKQKGVIYVGEVMEQGQSDEVTIVGDGGTPPFVIENGDTVEYQTYNEKVWTSANPGQAHNVPSAFGAHRRIIRYADVLLMAAEALVYTGGDLGQAANYVNLIRARAREGQTGVLPDITPDGDLLSKIKHERRTEMFLEGHRFFDLVRWGETNKMEPFGFQYPKNKFMPLPQSEIDIAGGRLVQNPGY